MNSLSFSWRCGLKLFACLAIAFVSLAASSRPVSAQVLYRYTGNTFDLFSCGGNILCSTPNPANTSYTTNDFVTATLTLDEPLPANLNLQDIRGFAGFKLTMNDGHQELTLDPGVSGEAMVSTDAEGNIIGPWSLIINCCFFPNNGISTLNWPGGRGVSDGGTLSAPTAPFPDTPFDLGVNFGSPGVWTVVESSPVDLIEDLISDLNGLVAIFELKPGQANGLIRPLENALRSIDQGKTAPACNQLQDFIDEVVAKTPSPLSVVTSNDLIAKANAARSLLPCGD